MSEGESKRFSARICQSVVRTGGAEALLDKTLQARRNPRSLHKSPLPGQHFEYLALMWENDGCHVRFKLPVAGYEKRRRYGAKSHES